MTKKPVDKPSTPLEFNSRDQWRNWLEKNYATEQEARLLLYKKPFEDQGLKMDEAVEEALCFGWIDSVAHRFDEKRYALRFSPRKRNSVWSVSNIERVEKLIAAGKMTEAGLLKIAEAKANGAWDAAIEREQVGVIPEDLERELQNREGALQSYLALSDSQKKQYLYSLQSAKREETRQRRIQKIVEEMSKE